MMKAHFKIALLAAVLLSCASLRAQQLSLNTNYLLNAYAYNPAVAGAKPYVQSNIYYRNQWVGFDGAPKTFLVSLYGPLKKVKNLAVGGMVVSDKSGLITSNSGYISVGYHVKLTKKLRAGLALSGGLNQMKVRLYDVRAYDQGDDMLTGNILTANTFDGNAGIYIYSDKFFLGLSDQHMYNNKLQFKNPQGRENPHYYATIGYTIKASKTFSVQPSILVKYSSPTVAQPEYSLKFMYNNVAWVGANYRTRDGVAFLAGVTVIKKLNIAYSFDYSLTSIRKYNQGSHEIMLNYNFIPKKNASVDEEEFKIIDNSIHQSIKNKKTTSKTDDSEPSGKKEEEKKTEEPK